MAQTSKPRKAPKGDKKKEAAKHAAVAQRKKSKSRAATKFHTEELRSVLDRDASTLYSVHQNVAHVPTPITANATPETSVADLADTLGNL